MFGYFLGLLKYPQDNIPLYFLFMRVIEVVVQLPRMSKGFPTDRFVVPQVWEHMANQGVNPREEQYVNYLCGLGVAGNLWKTARAGKLDDKLLEMSYHARCVFVCVLLLIVMTVYLARGHEPGTYRARKEMK